MIVTIIVKLRNCRGLFNFDQYGGPKGRIPFRHSRRRCPFSKSLPFSVVDPFVPQLVLKFEACPRHEKQQKQRTAYDVSRAGSRDRAAAEVLGCVVTLLAIRACGCALPGVHPQAFLNLASL